MKLFLILLSVAVATVWLQVPHASADEFKYMGIRGCTKSCHKKDKVGNQKKVWQKSDHAEAFQTLASDEAKEKAVELGVNTDPQKSEACLVCHTTGYGQPAARFNKKFKIENGVQCEACHGAGEKYRKKKIMKKISKERGPDKKGHSATAEETGLLFPTEKACKTCHAREIEWNGKTFKNPSYEAFDFDEFYKKIKHPKP